ncbi:hypothetical protein K6119_18585 [Paracrocinitomix mangrovi]|uniref:hypothetical protein n=1 Tax=Paracrocinitomix mangrovi TaxID=2862509 RepID=UPI001C8E9EFA|nr:hypothetical protein [Paracrocinitomix mangrovi]UKN01735.1 hypothetical protein K6119_18585 [Paracrocinitomix mangrovi]
MKKLLTSVLLLVVQYGLSQSVWINEIHYDNSGTDVGEGFEIAAPAGTDLSCYQVILYNGNGGAAYSTINLSGTVPDNGCGIGTVWFAEAGMQNGNPDGIALYNTCTNTVEQFLSYGGSFTATDGPAVGVTSTDIGVTEGSGTAAGESLQLTGGPGNTYGDFTWTTAATATEDATNNSQDFCTTPCGGLDTEPTDDVTDNGPVVSCYSADLNWTLGTDADNVIVVFSTSPITGTPADGTQYNVGDLIAPGEEVIYSGSSTSVSLNSLIDGTTYYYAIFEYNGFVPNCEENYLTGGIISSFTTATGCAEPYIQSVNYNACTGAEGTDEIVVVQMGADPVPVDSLIIELPNTTWCNVGCGSNTIVNNQAYLDDLNALAGCTPDLFTYCDPIPAGANLMIFTGNPPSALIDYSNNCGGSYCAIFLNNTATAGNFSNTSSTPRVTTIYFGSTSSSTVEYTATDGPCTYGSGCDGETANYDQYGNLIDQSVNTDCIYPLAVVMRSLSGYHSDGKNFIEWSTASEENTLYFEVLKSRDGSNWEVIDKIDASRNSVTEQFYSSIDANPEPGINYYRLRIYDANGSFENTNIISIKQDALSTYFNENQITIGFEEKPNKNYTLNIYSLNGSLVYSAPAKTNMTIDWQLNGFFILEIPELELRSKLITH